MITMTKIILTRDKFSLVDIIDLGYLNQWSWCYNQGYAVRNSIKSDNFDKRKTILMHRVILQRCLGHSKFIEVDHINGDRLDNQRSNLRPCNQQQNQGNRKHQRGSSYFKGVYWSKANKKWTARIKINGKKQYLGYFCHEIDAAIAYNTAAIKHFGEFARLNNLRLI